MIRFLKLIFGMQYAPSGSTPRGEKDERRRRAYLERTAESRRRLLEKRGAEAFWSSPKGKLLASAIAEEQFHLHWRDRESQLRTTVANSKPLA
jgi:hypothetical protein